MSALIKPEPERPYPTLARGDGCYLYDSSGRQYLDGCSGAITSNIGHGHPAVAAAVARQMRDISFAYRTQFTSAPAERLAERLTAVSSHVAAVFTNSGSEAIETAIRAALLHWRLQGAGTKTQILSRRVSYHGSTFGALNVSGHFARRRPFASMLTSTPNMKLVEVERAGRHDAGHARTWDMGDELEATILKLGAENVAGFIFEPVVGASGAAIPTPGPTMKRYRDICDRHGVLLIADEVMTGLGRTGRWFGVEHAPVKPDISVIGKGLNAGYTPISAVLMSPGVAASARDGRLQALGHTHAGNPLSAAIGNAVLDVIEQERLVPRAARMGSRLGAALEHLAERHDCIVETRGLGLLRGVEIRDPALGDGGRVDPGLAGRLVDAAFEEGLLIYPCGGFIDGAHGAAVLVAPPLTIDDADIERLVDRLDRALQGFAAGRTHFASHRMQEFNHG